MNYNKKTICTGNITLILSTLVLLIFMYWLFTKTEDELARDFYIKINQLTLTGNQVLARQLQQEQLLEGGDNPLDTVWLNLVQSQENGYDQLLGYLRLLKSNPDREASYLEIANIIKDAPPSFKSSGEKTYLSKLFSIENIRIDLLNQYGLIWNE